MPKYGGGDGSCDLARERTEVGASTAGGSLLGDLVLAEGVGIFPSCGNFK